MLILGGWPIGHGRRAFAFVTPEFGTAAAGEDGVRFLIEFVEAPEGLLNSIGLGAFNSEPPTTPFLVLPGSQRRTILFEVTESGEGSIGRSHHAKPEGGRIRGGSVVVGRLPGVAGPVAIGPMIQVVPRLLENGASVYVTVEARYNLLNKPSE